MWLPKFRQSLVAKTKPRATGFVLPCALSASAVLLLGSASIHTLSLKGRLRLQAAMERDQAADQLRSAAQAFTTMASGAQACLLLWPSVDWTFRKKSCFGAEPKSLWEGSVADQQWQLLSWQPSPGSGDLRLALADGRRAHFRLKLAPNGSQVLGISAVQLIGRDGSESSS
ncbi:hypothetical protein SynBIOSU31_00726 [Synechococcus sp. BIOS-U3-1]|nr:hypothetical protein SynBIOSU31_00726 [Synechococcus sp. BIOS-U3-1]